MRNAELELYRCLANDLRGLNIEPCPELTGFILRDAATNKAVFTAYVGTEGFSCYQAIDDGRGYDIADEKPICINVPLFAAVAKVKARHRQFAPELYATAMDTSEAYAAGYWD